MTAATRLLAGRVLTKDDDSSSNEFRRRTGSLTAIVPLERQLVERVSLFRGLSLLCLIELIT